MNTAENQRSIVQGHLAVQRLTAVWAFSESGLGGVLHALQIPFTGLVVGGMAILLISLIAFFSSGQFKIILRSALIVLIVKAMVSPNTPFPAYVAVGFQAVLGYLIFSLMKINLVSLLILSMIAMLESALQKLIILTLFFGQSLWKAADSLGDFIAKQMSVNAISGSNWVIGIYLFIYCLGGLAVAWMSFKTIKEFSSDIPLMKVQAYSIDRDAMILQAKTKKQSSFKFIFFVLIMVSLLLFVFAADTKQAWLAVIKTICWTISAIIIWYQWVSPFLTGLIQKIVKRKSSPYATEITTIISFLPVLKQLAQLAWQKTTQYRGFKRLRYFVLMLIHWSLTWTDASIKNAA